MVTRKKLRVQKLSLYRQVHLADNFCKMSFTFSATSNVWNCMESVASAGFFFLSGEQIIRSWNEWIATHIEKIVLDESNAILLR